MPKRTNAQLLVEGKNDQHVVWALCQQHQVAETFSVELPSKEEGGGIDPLLASIPVRLKISGLQALGIVVDADQNLQGRWDAVRHRLAQAGYENIPVRPNNDGVILIQPERPKAGVWLMPDNELPGMLEHFVAHLIPDNDLLSPEVEDFLHKIEQAGINRYISAHHPKAFIHSWLACQANPGQPMGQAITAQVLLHDKPLAVAFVDWLTRLFAPPNL